MQTYGFVILRLRCLLQRMSEQLNTFKKKILSLLEILYTFRWPALTIIFLATLIKAALLIYLTSCSNPEIKLGHISFESGDTFSYTGATENLVTHGSYYFFNGKENVYAGRTPHYGVPYFFLRQLFDVGTSYDLLILIQLILEVLAAYCLFRLCFQITASQIASLTLLVLCLLSTNWTSFSIYASPESLSISLLVFFLYHFNTYTTSLLNRDLLIAGVFLSVLVCLKVYYILVFLPVGIFFLVERKMNLRDHLIKVIFKSVLVSLPLFVFLTPWAIRNYQLLHQFIPLQINATAGYNYSKSELAFRKYVTAWGGNIIFWEANSAGCYFMPRENVPCNFQMPAHAFTKNYGATEVEEVRARFVQLQQSYSDSLDAAVADSFLRMFSEYKSEKPFEYYLRAPAMLTYKFLAHSGSYYLPIHGGNPCYSSFQLPLKAVQSLCYWLCLLVGVPGIILLGYHKRNLILPFIPLILIIVFPIVLKTAEARYFRTVEPVLLIGIGYVVQLIMARIMKTRAS
jgi:hypothetical protein